MADLLTGGKRLGIVRACRGDGVAYAQVRGLPGNVADMRARVVIDAGRSIPGTVVPLDDGSVAIAFPLLGVGRFALQLQDRATGDSLGHASMTSAGLAIRSKAAYALRREDALRLRDCDLRGGSACASVRFTQVIEDGSEYVVRARVDLPRPLGASERVTYRVLDEAGAPMELEPLVLEDCDNAVDERGRAVRRITVALRVSRERRICLVAMSEDGALQPGACALDEGAYRALRDGFLAATADAAHDPEYDAWWRSHRASMSELDEQRATTFEAAPLFSIVVPLYRTPARFFDEMLGSVLSQSYPAWELVLVNASPDDEDLVARLAGIDDARVVVAEALNEGIAQNTNVGIQVAKGDYVCFLDHDDALAPDALFEYARAIERDPDIDVLYCDEDRFDDVGAHHAPFFKPDFSPELLRAHNYITHLLCVSRRVIDDIGLLRAEYEGAQDYDYTLRATERARRVAHVPRVLYHWRMHALSTSVNPDSKSYAGEAGRRAVQAHCDRRGISATVERTDLPFAYRVNHGRRDRGPVDVVIPTKDHVDVLRPCVESLLKRCSYADVRIVLVENNSERDETFSYYEDLLASDSRVRIVTWPGGFNYSKIVNFGAAQGCAPHVLFLNNDTEVINPGFLDEMLGQFDDAGVGVVGAKLLFADGTVQHGGVGVGLTGAAAHLFTSLPAQAGGYFERARLPQNLSAVTGACQLVRRDVLERVGGYTEKFAVGYNDVDFCLKVIDAGYRVVYAPDALLHHHEFASRGRDMSGERVARVEQETALLRKRWPDLFERGDPYLNPNLSRDSCYFALGK